MSVLEISDDDGRIQKLTRGLFHQSLDDFIEGPVGWDDSVTAMVGFEARKFGLEEAPYVRICVIFLETKNATARLKGLERHLDYMSWPTCDKDTERKTPVPG